MDRALLQLVKELKDRATDYATYGGRVNAEMLDDAEKRLLEFVEENYDRHYGHG